MKQTEISLSLQVVCGIEGETPYPANAAVLKRQTKVWRKTNPMDSKKTQVEVTEFLAVTGVKSTKVKDVIIPLLSLYVAEYQTRNDLNSVFAYYVDANGDTAKTGLRAQKQFARFLHGNCIFKTDTEGNCTKGFLLPEGMMLGQTALNVKSNHAIVSATHPESIRTLLNLQANFIGKQCTMYRNLIVDANNMYQIATEATEASETSESNKDNNVISVAV